jgi:ATP-dependent Clp protease ATP-binding subunit ClpC
MADPPTSASPGGTPNPTEPTPAGLDVALGWLQHNLDQLTDVMRRREAVTSDPPLPTPAASLPTPVASDPAPPLPVPADADPDPAAPLPDPAPLPARGDPSSTRQTSSTSQPSSTPLLDKVGRDLTRLAAAGSLAPVIGRESETEFLIEVLCRSTERNPVLLGPAGVGKTAIVEGLAQRIAAGKVPPPLQGARIIEVPLAGLVAGTEYRGQLEERLQQLVTEASQPGVILFLDEIHLLEGVGRSEGGVGVGEVLKPALARGNIAVIGATTDDEYRATIGQDPALARRFTTVQVPELDKEATRPVLRAARDRLAVARGVHVSDPALEVLLDYADTAIINRRFPEKALDLLEQAVARAIVAGDHEVDRDAAVRTTQEWAARSSATPTLTRFGRDLIALAQAGKLGPIVGRDRELEAMEEVLLRRTKRDPLLLGPAGAGKTAIVEGLAIRIAGGHVPAALKDVRLFDVPILTLATAIASDATLLPDLLVEARHPSVVVFFDEIHLLSTPAAHDLSQALKPALARGEIACIGATTGEEYQANLESDAALARRFSIISIEPMDADTVRQVLCSVRDSLAAARHLQMGDDVVDEAIRLADRFLPGRSFPDKGVDIIEQSMAYAVAHGLTTVDVATARAAAAEMAGLPLDPTERIASLASELQARNLLDTDALQALRARLDVTMRGLDAHPAHPDAVVLLCGPAADGADALAAAIARNLYGNASAVIPIDLGGLTDDSAISTLLGSAPGLVGSERSLPLQELRRTPWQVVLLRSVDRCAASIRSTIAGALAQGSFTDAMGRAMPLGGTIGLLTAAGIPPPATSAPGASAGPPPFQQEVLGALLGPDLVAACDVITFGGAASASDARRWLQTEVLDPLAARFAAQGYQLTFEPGFVAWLATKVRPGDPDADAFVDRSVTPAIAAASAPEGGSLTVGVVNDQTVARPLGSGSSGRGQALV